MARTPETICLLYATFPDSLTANRTAHALVEAHLAACCNILPGVQSVFWWNGAVQESPEAVMLIKTTQAMAEAATQAIIRTHPYENPAIMQLPVTSGAAEYLSWIATTVLPGDTAI